MDGSRTLKNWLGVHLFVNRYSSLILVSLVSNINMRALEGVVSTKWGTTFTVGTAGNPLKLVTVMGSTRFNQCPLQSISLEWVS